jgi:hypothetical protein
VLIANQNQLKLEPDFDMNWLPNYNPEANKFVLIANQNQLKLEPDFDMNWLPNYNPEANKFAFQPNKISYRAGVTIIFVSKSLR